MDAAIARVRHGIPVDPRLPRGKPIYYAAGTVDEKDKVFKHGAMTGKTRGKVTVLDRDFELPYKDADGVVRYALFEDQIKIAGTGRTKRFARDGDSGSLVLKTTNAGNHVAVGLLFAASENGRYGYASPLRPILAALKIKLLSS